MYDKNHNTIKFILHFETEMFSCTNFKYGSYHLFGISPKTIAPCYILTVKDILL